MGREVLLELDEDLFFLLAPAMEGDLVTPQTEPLEEARVGGGAGDDGGDESPALLLVVDLSHPHPLLLAVLADQPDQDLEVADAPVPLQLPRLRHPS